MQLQKKLLKIEIIIKCLLSTLKYFVCPFSMLNKQVA